MSKHHTVHVKHKHAAEVKEEVKSAAADSGAVPNPVLSRVQALFGGSGAGTENASGTGDTYNLESATGRVKFSDGDRSGSASSDPAKGKEGSVDDTNKDTLAAHKVVVQNSINELNAVINQDLGKDSNAKAGSGATPSDAPAGAGGGGGGAGGGGGNPVPMIMLNDGKAPDEPIKKKRYAEEDEYELSAAKRLELEKERCYEWIDKTIGRVLFNTALLVILAALLTAMGCYVFVQLPKSIYSSHLLIELFMCYDELLEENKQSMGFGIRCVAYLPSVIAMLYMIILYFIYMVQYPQRNRSLIIARYMIFVGLEVYLCICTLSYMAFLPKVETQLDKIHTIDRKGIYYPYEKHTEKFHLLERSQEYYGCCGYKTKKEWSKVFPDKYSDKYPLSCCDSELSQVACYGPVHEMVTYEKRNDEGDKNPDGMQTFTKKRIFKDTCYGKEYWLSMVVISSICVIVTIFTLIATWNLIMMVRLTHLVNSRELVLREKERYIDFF